VGAGGSRLKGGLMGEFNLPRYVSLLKNLRAVCFLDPGAPTPEEELKWVSRRYRYRSLGISRLLLERLPGEVRSVFTKRPYAVLGAPIPEIAEFHALVAEGASIPDYVAASIVMASCYVNPILVLGRESYNALRPLASWEMTSTSELPDVEVKRNLRIIGYAILDFHERVTHQAYDAMKSIALQLVEQGDVEGGLRELRRLLEERCKLAQADGEQRVWRLRRSGW